MKWEVKLTRKAGKQLTKLPAKVKVILQLLTEELGCIGPNLHQWPNYCKLKGRAKEIYHCHLIKGKPTYVVCWEVICKKNRLIEVYYVGTHEKAPY